MTRLIFSNGDMAFVSNGVITGYTGVDGRANDLTRLRLRCRIINEPKEGFRITMHHPDLPAGITITHEEPVERIERIKGFVPNLHSGRVHDGKGADEPADHRASPAQAGRQALAKGDHQHGHTRLMDTPGKGRR